MLHDRERLPAARLERGHQHALRPRARGRPVPAPDLAVHHRRADLLLAAPAPALPVGTFTDTKTFAASATDVVIAECLDPDAAPGPKLNGVTEVRVDVVQVLKGERKPGKATLVTIGQPMEKGRRYMMASFGGSVRDIKFLTNFDLGVVEVPATFDLKTLDGKTVAEQVQLVFDARREQVRIRLIELEREKALLEKTAPKKP